MLFNMCDQQCYDSCTWNSFYHHYLNQHSIMTQYIQHLMQNTSSVNAGTTCQTSYCDFHDPMKLHYRPQCQDCCSSESHSTSCSSTSGSSTSTSIYSNVNETDDDCETDERDDESEFKYEFNVEAILAMRAAKEELKEAESTSDSDSIVMINSDKEEFEFVELGSHNTLATRLSRLGSDINRTEELKAQKKIVDYLYGEKSAVISGLESAMAVNFEQLYDTHQPSMWPVLPVRL